MLKAVSTFCLLNIFSIAVAEQAEIPLWPNGLPEGAVELTADQIQKITAKVDPERIKYVEIPTLTFYPAKSDNNSGTCVIICPGGGYNILAWPKEGVEVAKWFNSIGVNAAVLKYRVPRRVPNQRHLEPLQDAQRAVRLVRQHAEAWNIDPNRIGMLGFSAGGHLTLMTGMHSDTNSYPPRDDVDKLSARPDFLCPIYAAYQGIDYADKGPLGDLIRVTKQTPPTFLAVTADDSGRGVHAARLFIELHKAGVPAELHVYERGGHGYGIRPSDKPVSTWHARLADWMKQRGLLTSN